MRVLAVMWVLGVACASAGAEWEMQESHTTASLRGIHAVSGTVAWASGTEGTVLRTVDGGKHWTKCAVPEGAEKLDFRGVHAGDERTAVVMSSGKGDLSRLYATVDGCATWKLMFVNPDAEGFWDFLGGCCRRSPVEQPDKRYDLAEFNGIILGDPVEGRFAQFSFHQLHALQLPEGQKIFPVSTTRHKGSRARVGEAVFAASNSSVFHDDRGQSVYGFDAYWVGTGGKSGARILRRYFTGHWDMVFEHTSAMQVPVGGSNESSGVFSIAFRSNLQGYSAETHFLSGVAVGGDYKLPEDAQHVAIFSGDGGKTWNAPVTQPHGYRSAVAYNEDAKAWITVGPNGTDVSVDDGKNWKAVGGENAAGWNALSLPFVVGPKGRIGVWKATAK